MSLGCEAELNERLYERHLEKLQELADEEEKADALINRLKRLDAKGLALMRPVLLLTGETDTNPDQFWGWRRAFLDKGQEEAITLFEAAMKFVEPLHARLAMSKTSEEPQAKRAKVDQAAGFVPAPPPSSPTSAPAANNDPIHWPGWRNCNHYKVGNFSTHPTWSNSRFHEVYEDAPMHVWQWMLRRDSCCTWFKQFVKYARERAVAEGRDIEPPPKAPKLRGTTGYRD